MAKSYLSDYSPTPASNTDIDGVDSTGATGRVKDGDNYTRSVMSHLAKFYDDLGAVNTVGGTATAITVTAAEGWTAYGSSANQIDTGTILAIKTGSAATGAATLNVNGIGAKAIRGQGDVAIQANDWIAGAILILRYDASFNGAAGAWVLTNTILSLTPFTRTLLDDVDAAAARTTLGADTLYVSMSIDFSVVAGDRGKAFGVSASGAARTVTLLAAATAGVGFEVIVKKTDGSANTVTIDADAAETIDGATTYVLRLKDNAVRLRSDGVNWRVVASHLPAEYGVGANGSYLRFPDGTQICWQNITVTGTWGASGNVFIFSSSAAGNWAAAFAAQPTMAAFNSSPTSGYFWTAANGCTVTDFAGVSLWRAAAAGATTNTVGLIGIGRWF